MKRAIMLTLFIIQSITSFTHATAQDFQIREISDKIFIVTAPDGGESQLVIKTEKGLVVFNTFWSEITAQKYKEEITRAFNREDFAYTINMVDRLDMFGGNATYKETMIIGHESFLEKYQGK